MKRWLIPLFACIAIAAFLIACGSDSSDGNNNDDDDGAVDAPVFDGRSPDVAFSDLCQKSDEKQFAGPETVIDQSKTYVATIETSKGTIVAELDAGTRPVTVNSFVFLSCKGFYDGLTFHRVEPGFVIQGGDPTGTGGGGPGYSIEGEFAGATFGVGVLAMARTSDPNSAGSQFFITIGEAPHLNEQYAAFGNVTEGMEVAQSIAVGDSITSITIEER